MMAQGRVHQIRKTLAAGLLAMGLVVTTSGVSMADEAAAPAGPNTGKISLTAGFDVATQYWFRGIAQENQGFILQPYATIGFNLYKGDGALSSIDLSLGTWNSGHSHHAAGSGPDAWYESDIIAGVSATCDKFTVGATFTAYTSPSGAYSTVQEVAFSLGYDDSDLLGAWALNPTFTAAVETSGSADGAHSGEYYGLSFGPSFTLVDSKEYPITLSIPVTIGLGNNYYESATTGEDPTFGYADIGADVSMPLAFMPSDYGSWSVHAGVHVILLGSSAKSIAGPAVTSGDTANVYGVFGVSFTY